MYFEVASFWTGSDLSYMEHLCMKSYVDNGYTFHLFTKGPVRNIPDYVEHHNADEIYTRPDVDNDDVRVAGAVYADIWRIHLMQKTDFCWVDMDMVCVRPVEYKKDHYFGVNFGTRSTNNCVLRLPRSSPALMLVQDFYESKTPIPHWLDRETLDQLFESMRNGFVPTLEKLPWMTVGPSVLNWALRVTNEIDLGQHFSRYWQINATANNEFLDPNFEFEFEGPNVRMVHMFGKTKLNLRDQFEGIPPSGSYVDRLCKRHGIDLLTAPIPEYKADAYLTRRRKVPF